ncbi:hypothetical protein N7475_000169 [Penicillium sp. IBT 31633x]|nr:hypothetical protein N7475_000169 [Penicillium sp. IBT 31633x]
MAPALNPVEREELRKRRVKREQLRKRRNNLLRRHNEFWLLYGMKSWLIMESPDGQSFTYHSHPDTPPPSREDIKIRRKSTVVRTPRHYSSMASGQPVDVLNAPVRQHNIWEALAQLLENSRRMLS